MAVKPLKMKRAVGERHHRAKLTDAQVEEMRAAWEDPADTRSAAALGAAYGVSKSVAYAIVTFARRNAY